MSAPGRLLRVLHVFGRLERGGAELRAIELAESFRGERVRSDFLVLTGLDGALDDRVAKAGGEVIKCRLGAGFPAAFYRLLRARRYDVVESHVHYFSGVILAIARLAGTRGRVAVFHTTVVNDRQDTRRRRAQLAFCGQLIHRTATDIVAVGEGAMNGAWNPTWRSDPRCRVVHNGIPLERVGRIPHTRPDVPTIVNVASLQPLKNQLRLVHVLGRMVRRLPAVQLRLIGKSVGDYGQEVQRAAADAGLADRVHFVGEVDDPMPWIAGANLMMLPSLWEGLPCAALEACALGVPVLASDLPGTRELAAHFPYLRVMSLDEEDEAWAGCAARLIEHGVDGGVGPAEWLAKSPFTLERSREARFEIWSRARAS